MNRATAFFLLLLRLAIGWHFLVEGYSKLQSTVFYPGGEGTKSFSSATYFQEGPGPFAAWMREQIGDPNEAVFVRLTAKPGRGEEGKAALPDALNAAMDAYVAAFVKQYKLDADAHKQADEIAAKAKDKMAKWLTSEKMEVTKVFPTGSFVAEQTMPQRLDEFRAKLDAIKELVEQKNPTMGKDVEKARLLEAKGDAIRVRNELNADLEKKTTELLKKPLVALIAARYTKASLPWGEGADEDERLLSLLTIDPAADKGSLADQLPKPLAERWDKLFGAFVNAYQLTGVQKDEAEKRFAWYKDRTVRWLLNQEQYKGEAWPPPGMPQLVQEYRNALATLEDSPKSAEARSRVANLWYAVDQAFQAREKEMTDSLEYVLTNVPGGSDGTARLPAERTKLWWVDRLTMWGLFGIGVCLIGGLFTRLACLLGAGFLVLTYLAAPPFPWYPAPPQTEGTYYFVNKNVIELLALLALATTASGRWAGLDALFFGPPKSKKEDYARDR